MDQSGFTLPLASPYLPTTAQVNSVLLWCMPCIPSSKANPSAHFLGPHTWEAHAQIEKKFLPSIPAVGAWELQELQIPGLQICRRNPSSAPFFVFIRSSNAGGSPESRSLDSRSDGGEWILSALKICPRLEESRPFLSSIPSSPRIGCHSRSWVGLRNGRCRGHFLLVSVLVPRLDVP